MNQISRKPAHAVPFWQAPGRTRKHHSGRQQKRAAFVLVKPSLDDAEGEKRKAAHIPVVCC
jgi:hypothetical protein